MLKQGVIILATGHGFYGRMAWNLCATIKAVHKDFPIAIVHDNIAISHLNAQQRSLFDIHIPAEQLGFAGKLDLPRISPFEQTLYLDADMAWLPKYSPIDLIATLKGIDFASITEGHSEDPHPKYYFWANLDEIREKYQVEKVYQWRSEVMYFTKAQSVQDMFARAREIYANPGLTTIHRFGSHVPDELAINIATAEAGIIPHVYKWCPAFWPRMHGEGGMSLEAMYSKYYLLSCGSNVVTNNTMQLYNRIVKSATYKLGMQHVFPLMNKRDVIKERSTV